MTDTITNTDIPAPAGSVAENDEDVTPAASKPTVNNSSHSASVLDQFVEGLKESKEGAEEVGMFVEWIESMVNEGIEKGLGMKDHRGRTLLHVAAIEGLLETAKRLIERKAELNARDDWGDTPLIDACGEGDGEGDYIEVVKLLLNKGAEARVYGNHHQSPLYRAARNGHSLIVQHLLTEVEWDLNVGEETYHMTPLHAAALANDSKTVRYLRNEGAKLYSRDTDRWTPLMTATDSKSTDAMEELLQRRNHEDLQLETKDSEGLTPILRAAEQGFWDGFRLLVKAGSKWTEYDSENTEAAERDSVPGVSRKNAALHLAISENQDEVVHFLVKHGADVNYRGQNGRRSLHLAGLQGNMPILEVLLGTGKCKHLNIGDDEGMTPLHHACAAREDDGRYNDVVRLLLNQNSTPYSDAVIKELEKAVKLAFEHGHKERGEIILDVLDPESSWASDTLLWAVGETKRHDFAASLLKMQVKSSPTLDAESSEGWAAIEWAAYARKPQALWLLIANSPQSNETKTALKSAKAIVGRFKNKILDELDDTQTQESTSSQEIHVRDIIDNPPTGLLCTERPIHGPPEYDPMLSSPKRYEATMVQFYRREKRFVSIMKSQSIKETIYKQGPTKIMKDMVDKLRKFTKSHLNGLGGVSDVQRPVLVDPDSQPEFTWIHLPATNMIWMDDLLQKIMTDAGEDEGCINQVKSFFKDSWIEVPDKVSASRIMRPKYSLCNTREKCEGRMVGEDTKEGNGMDRGDTAEQPQMENGCQQPTATAVYIPYLSYSFQYGGKHNAEKEEDDDGNVMSSQSMEQSGQMPATIDEAIRNRHTTLGQKAVKFGHKKKTKYQRKTEHDKGLEYAKRLKETAIQYESLLREYCGKVIHGSSTLDESYYHFGEDRHSTEDKARRNKSQVVTDIWREQHVGPTRREEELGLYWPLVRVNQLWIWTVNNKWLISASSHPIDDSENELLSDILDRLEKEREAGGSDLQQVSTVEMSQFIVDYCIDSYDRKPKEHDSNRPATCRLRNFPSIRQAFSKSINSIARDETNLSDQFRTLRIKMREKLHRNSAEHSKTVPDIMPDQELDIAEATAEAEGLSRRVKDILDELSMLEVTVQYQQDVQKAMRTKKVQRGNAKHGVLETDLTATYIINDIKRLNSVAERAHLAVNTTLSLHQSEVANLQAELTMREGKVLMVFTVVTILFLPLSFMTSFFALDVASFQQAPPWAIGVIFAVSFGLFIPMVIIAFSWERSKTFVLGLMPKLIHHAMLKPLGLDAKEISEQSIGGLWKLAWSSNRTRDVKSNSNPAVGSSGAPFQVAPQRRTGLSDRLRFRSRRQKDVEEGGHKQR